MQFQEKGKLKNTLDKKPYNVLLDWIDEGFFVNKLHTQPNGPLNFKSIAINKAFGKQSTLRNVKRKIALHNLIPNIIQFTRPNGKITIPAVLKENEPEISFLDNGIGITQNKMEKLFKTDKNIPSLITNGEEGRGPGHTLYYEFVTKYGKSTRTEKYTGERK